MGTDGPSPVFLLSSERSGSNLVRSILNTHSEVTAPHPLETVYPWRKTVPPGTLSERRRRCLIRDILINKHYSFQPLVETLDASAAAARLEELGPESFLDVQEALYGHYSEVTDASSWVSKDPGQWDYLERAFDHYSDLKVVYLVRDPRDVVLSFKTSNVGRYHPYFTAGRWRDEQRTGLELLENRPDRVHRVRYEELLQDPETVVEAVCTFLDIEFEPGMLYYYETADARAASESAGAFENLSIPIKRDNFGKYKDLLPDEETQITETVTRAELIDHGYSLDHDPSVLDAHDLDPARYAAEDARLSRTSQIEYWLQTPREQVARFTTRSFSYYMILRYGLLA